MIPVASGCGSRKRHGSQARNLSLSRGDLVDANRPAGARRLRYAWDLLYKLRLAATLYGRGQGEADAREVLERRWRMRAANRRNP